jgi:FixJ family two-component response regulator
MTEERPVVYVVDDDARVRESLSDLIESMGFQVATFATALEFIEVQRVDAPGCLILDLNLPGANGLQLQQALVGSDAPPIVFLSGHADIPSSVRAMKAGAIEFLTKPFRQEELVQAIENAIALDRVARQKRSALAELQGRYNRLTPREREVLPLVASGRLNKQTAAELGTSHITVRVHRGQIMHKMGAQSLSELVRMAETLGLI